MEHMLRVEVRHEPCPRWLLSGTDLWNSRAMDQAVAEGEVNLGNPSHALLSPIAYSL